MQSSGVMAGGKDENMGMYNNTDIMLRDGAVVQRLKEVKIVRGILILRVELFDDILRRVLNISLEYENREDSIWFREISDISSCSRLTDNWESFFINKTAKRTKRGAFNLGGDILSSLFGTSTTKQLDTLRKSVGDKIETHSIKLDELYKINKMQNSNMKRMTQALQELSEQYTQDEKILFSYKISRDIIRLCEAYNRLRINLQLGHVNPHMLNLLHIKNLVATYGYKWNLETIVGVEDVDFEKMLKTKVLKIKKGQVALISIPFVEKETFRFYKVSPLPMFSSSFFGKKFEITVNSEYILTNFEEDKISLVTEDFVETCNRALDKVLMCSNVPWVKVNDKTKDICEVELLVEKTSKNCNFEGLSNSTISTMSMNGYILLSGIPQDTLLIRCGTEITQYTLPFSGIGLFPENCYIRSKYVVYRPTMHKELETMKVEPRILKNDVINVSNTHKISSMIMEVKNSVGQIETEIDMDRNLPIFKTQKVHAHVTLWGFMVSLVVMLVLVAGIAVYVGHKKFKYQLVIGNAGANKGDEKETEIKQPRTVETY